MTEEKNHDEEVIYRSCRQGGIRYENAISENGKNFIWDFADNLYMKATPIWNQLENGAVFKSCTSNDIFGNNNPLFVEIGIGNGEFTAYHAGSNPNQNWIGFEVYHKIFEKAISKAKTALKKHPESNNIKLMQFDAELFVRMLPDNSVSGFFVNFPDPWPKAKHTKRRLLKPWFIDLMRQKLIDGCCMTLVTDHDDYAAEITENIAQVKGIESTLGKPFVNDIGDYYKTKYYRKFAEKGTVYFYNLKKVR